MCVPAGKLKGWLASLGNDNAQGEYTSPTFIVMAVRSGCEVHAVVAPTVTEVLGVNDKVQLAELEAAYRRQRATEFDDPGRDPCRSDRFDARGPVSVGRDVHIDVNVVLEGTVKLGNRVRVGPNVIIRDSEIGDDTMVFPNWRHRPRAHRPQLQHRSICALPAVRRTRRRRAHRQLR